LSICLIAYNITHLFFSRLATRPQPANMCRMSSDNEFDSVFRPKVGRTRDRSGRPLLSINKVIHQTARHGGNPRRITGLSVGHDGRPARTGRFNARGRGAKIVATFPREHGWSFEKDSGMRFRARRVIVKARVVKMRGTRSRAAHAHLRYLQRDGASRENAGRLYSAFEDEADGKKFLDRGQDDRHRFRLIVAPEDSVELGDLRGFTRQLMGQMERDLETKLDWVAVDHHNTAYPHTHVVIRGVTDDGKILNIAGDYIAHGIRHRAGEIVTLELGPQSEWEVQRKLGNEVGEDRFTRLDRAILEEANEDSLIDLRSGEAQSYLARVNRHLMIDRLKKLERLGLAQEAEPGRWALSPGLEQTLRDLGERSDIVKTMHRAVTERGFARSAELYVVHKGVPAEGPAIGRVIAKGLAGDEMTNRQHLVIDGLDGRVHYVEITEAAAEEIGIGNIVKFGPTTPAPRRADRTIAELARQNDGIYQPSEHFGIARATVRVPDGNHSGYVEAHVRRLEALRQAGIVDRLDADHWRIPEDFENRAQAYDHQRSRQATVRMLSLLDIDAQVTANAATWLDRELVAETPSPRVDFGFGQEARNAIAARRQWLIDEGLMRTEGSKTIYRRDMLAVLARREVEEVGQKLAAERGPSFRMMRDGERVTGTYKESVQLVSGKYALVENAREFTLVPWRPVIDRDLGRAVTGLVRGDGISWQLGRARGLGIGM
jgi:type IV secretory pathway VirD2 relaxase